MGWDRVPGGGTGSPGRDKEIRMGEVPRVRQGPQGQIRSPGIIPDPCGRTVSLESECPQGPRVRQGPGAEDGTVFPGLG